MQDYTAPAGLFLRIRTPKVELSFSYYVDLFYFKITCLQSYK
jgi:hypothetical protein